MKLMLHIVGISTKCSTPANAERSLCSLPAPVVTHAPRFETTPDLRMRRRKTSRRLSGEAGGRELLPPEPLRRFSRAGSIPAPPRGRRRRERLVVHDPGGRAAHGLLDVRPAGGDSERGRHFLFLDGLRRPRHGGAVQNGAASGCSRAGVHVGPRCRVVARSGLEIVWHVYGCS